MKFKKDDGDLLSRQAVMFMHPQVLLQFMTSAQWVIVENNLPKDIKFHHVYFDQQAQVFGLVCMSKEFKSLKLGAKLPEITPVKFRYWNPADGAIE